MQRLCKSRIGTWKKCLSAYLRKMAAVLSAFENENLFCWFLSHCAVCGRFCSYAVPKLCHKLT